MPLTKSLSEIIARRNTDPAARLFPTSPKRVTKNIDEITKGEVHVSPHDLRRTFAGVANVIGIPGHTVKMLLNHLTGRDDVTGGYIGELELDDLREAMERIESKMMQFVGSKADVVQLRA